VILEESAVAEVLETFGFLSYCFINLRHLHDHDWWVLVLTNVDTIIPERLELSELLKDWVVLVD